MIHIVFDLDGTLADTQIIHQKIESDFLFSKGLDIAPDSIGKAYAGRSPTEWIPECLNANGIIFSQDEIDAFVEGKDRDVIALLEKGDIKLMPEVDETLRKLSQQGVKMGISSGACRDFIDRFIAHFDLIMLEASTSANEVEHKKPAPDVFLASFEKLEKIHGKPTTKWVVGDGKTDIIGGNSSGASTVLCYNDYPIPYTARISRFSELIGTIL